MTFPNPKWLPGVSDTLDNAAAVDKGGGLVGLPITGHGFQAGQTVVLAGTVNYDTAFEIESQTANEIVIPATYVAEVFAGDETVVFGKQPILKEDFVALEDAILTQGLVRMQPFLIWDSTSQVSIKATADCPVSMQFTGMPNILNPAVQVNGGLSDGKIRTVTGNVAMDIASDLYFAQTEKPSQWYAVFAVAGDSDADFVLKAMPIMRVKSQTSQAIKTGTLVTPGTGINYAFTDDDLIGSMIYILTGDSQGLIREISDNDVSTDTRITYGGSALTLAAGDWFIILPNTNFRFVGTCFNNSGGNIDNFYRQGNRVTWLNASTISGYETPTVYTDITIACPFATAALIAANSNVWAGLPTVTPHTSASANYGGSFGNAGSATNYQSVDFPLIFCQYGIFVADGTNNPAVRQGYSYPPGCGF
jgi:hypothetical protein